MDSDIELQPLEIIDAQAPIRICDIGGWTDTWFASYGQVFNMAVSPYARVRIKVYPREARDDRVFLSAENYGDHYSLDLDQSSWGRHPLLEAAIHYRGVPEHLAVQISLSCDAPAGASTGTSAAISVALIGALDYLASRLISPKRVADAAHHVETGLLRLQSGVQDQLCSAYGGVNYIHIPAYPRSEVTRLPLVDSFIQELERYLVLVYLGKSHVSSQVHQQVIAELENRGPHCPQLQDLRQAALQARQAFLEADLTALGKAMQFNTAAQGGLHSSLINAEAQQVIDIAREHSALGWKVNGAGGQGGSLTLLCGPQVDEKNTLISEIQRENPLIQIIPIHLDRHGLQVWRELPPKQETSLHID
jgi:D-glycero-alpha-D-manno-heptose-7-phosphate kinase